MKHVFKSLTDNKEVDLIPYLKDKLSNDNPFLKERHFKVEDVEIYVGCDSQNHGDQTHYACVIVLHYGNNGGHVLYSKMKIDRVRERFVKLWKEVEFSMEVAQYLNTFGIRANFVDIDLNPDPRYGSNTVLRAALGFVESFGFVPRCKPFALSASYAADRLCK